MDRWIIEYLPHVLREVVEYRELMAAEQPELEALWAAQDAVLADQYLVTANEYGISRWEAMLGIFPKDTDDLEMRRAYVLSLLRLKLPYTKRWLWQWLNTLSDGLPFEVNIQDYTLNILAEWDRVGQLDGVKDILEQAIPSNIVINFQNAIKADMDSPLYIATGVVLCECIFISDSGKDTILIDAPAVVAAGVVSCEAVHLTDAGRDAFSINSPLVAPAGVIAAEQITITD